MTTAGDEERFRRLIRARYEILLHFDASSERLRLFRMHLVSAECGQVVDL